MKAKSVNELIGHKKAINGSLIQHLSPRFRSKTHLCTKLKLGLGLWGFEGITHL